MLKPSGIALLASTLFAAACTPGPAGSSKKTVNAFLAQQNYAQAQTYLDSVKETQYGQKNLVLFYLDRAAVLHHAGKFKESDADFAKAEQRMEELYTKSITQASGMLLLNDTTVDYAGEPFERALTNVMRALNYVFLNQPDEALVESRKVELFLEELKTRMGKSGRYSDDAFARYLDAMLYADQGKLDDARISLEAAKAAYADYEARYGMPQPKFEFPAPEKKSKNGELVFIHYNGVAPRKVSKTFQVAWNQAMPLIQQSDDTEANDSRVKNALAAGFMGSAITVGYPDIVQDAFTIASSEVLVDSRPAGATILMEDVTAIASKSLQDRMAAIKTRAIARAATKYVLAEVVSKAAAKACDQMPGGTFAIQLCKAGVKGGAHAAAAASEIADTRGWATLPAQIRMARLKIAEGKHDITILYKNAAGAVVTQQTFPDVVVAQKKRTYLAHRTAL